MQLRVPDPADPDGWTTVNIIDAQLSYAYDLLGRLETVTTDRRNRYPVVFDPQNPTLDETTRYTYNAVGSLKSIDYPNGQRAVYDYDAQNRLTDLVWSKDAAETYRYHYDLNADGQRAAVQEYYAGAVTPTAESEWTYDNLNRLTEEVFADGANDYTRRYGYDLVGNRKTVKDGTDSILTSYSYNDLDQLTFEDHTAGQDYSYIYDANGSLEQRIHGTDLQNDPADIYVYNLQGRLAGYTPAGAGTVTYAYNPQGIRIAKTAGGVTTHYTISPHNFTGYAQVLAADDGTNRTFYVLGSDVIGQSLNTAAPMYYLYDGHGSVRQDTDTAGTVTTSYAYDAYGNLIGGNPAADGLYYTGEMYDAALDSYYLRARYYAPATGRFNRLDPYAGNSYDPQSLHKYLYCHANPINGIDPSGQMTTTEKIVVLGISMNITMLGVDVSRALYHGIQGNEEESAEAWAWAIYDTLALSLPFSGSGGAAVRGGGVIVNVINMSKAGMSASAIMGYVRMMAQVGDAAEGTGSGSGSGGGSSGGGSDGPSGAEFMEKEGPGAWYKLKYNNLNAAKYQSARNGRPLGWDYYYNKVKFDGYRDGALLECKNNWKSLVSKRKGDFYGFIKHVILKQAKTQQTASNGMKVIWEWSDQEAGDACRKLFQDNNIPFDVRCVSQ